MSVSTSTVAGKTRYDFPIVTWALIGLNVLVYVAIAFTRREDHPEIYRLYGLTASHPTLFTMFTSCFLHIDIPHLASNMILLWIFGRSVERTLGVIGFLLLYVCSGLFAALTHLAIMLAFWPILQSSAGLIVQEIADQPSLGASGAIAGILGMYAVRFFRNKLRFLDIEIHPPILLLIWLILQVFLGMLSLYVDSPHLKGVDYWAHIGGFIFGILVAYFLHMANVGRKEYLLSGAEDTFKRGTLLDVIRKYEALLKCDRDDPFTNAELGRTWALLEDAEQALPYYQTAIDIYLKTDRGGEALARYNELIRILPGSLLRPGTVSLLADYLEQTGMPAKATYILNQLCSFAANSAECEAALLKVADIQLNRRKKPELAAITLRRFLETYPNSELTPSARQMLSEAEDAVEFSPP